MRCGLIFGSGKNAINTPAIVEYLASSMNINKYDLRAYDFSDYDYNHNNSNDDFIPLIKEIIAECDHWILITPVYWYSMSTVMKKFFDRISDLLKIEKEVGRMLRGKMMTVISNSGSDDQEGYFFKPFELSAEYLGMRYMGDFHVVISNGEITNEVKKKLDWVLESYS